MTALQAVASIEGWTLWNYCFTIIPLRSRVESLDEDRRTGDKVFIWISRDSESLRRLRGWSCQAPGTIFLDPFNAN